MGARRRDRASGRTLSVGWEDETPPTPRTAAGHTASAGHTAPAGHAASAGHTASTAQAGPAERDRSRRNRALIAILAVLVLVGTLLIALPRLLGAASGPEQVTRGFLQAVVEGDLEAVQAHVQNTPDASTAALTAEVLAGAEDQLDSFEIQHVALKAGTATVTVELRTGADTGQGIFTLTSSDGGPFSPTVWELAPVMLPQLPLELTFGVQEIEIEGVAFPVQDLLVDREDYEPKVALQLLPGTYEVSISQVPLPVAPVHHTLQVPATFGKEGMPVHDLHLALDEDAMSEVQRRAEEVVAECTASSSSAPEGCPFAVPVDGAEPGGGAEHGGEPGGGAEYGEERGDGAEPVAENGTWTLTSPPRLVAVPVSVFLWLVVGEGTATFSPADGAAPIEVPVSLNGVAAIDPQGDVAVRLDDPASNSFGYCTDPETHALTGAYFQEPGGDSPSGCG